LSNKEKKDYENFEKGMIYMKILKKGGVVEKRGEEETKYMPHAPVILLTMDTYETPILTDNPPILLTMDTYVAAKGKVGHVTSSAFRSFSGFITLPSTPHTDR
jgi:hypothetical protein